MTTARDDFLSGTSGEVSGIRATTSAVLADAREGARRLAVVQPLRLRRAAQQWPSRRVLTLAIERTDVPNVLPAAHAELRRSRHQVTFAATAAGARGKFENLNELLIDHPIESHDWLLVIDDDVVLPGGFLDVFIFLAERFQLRLAQPAHAYRSHAAWSVTRRRTGSVARLTNFVEIGPVVGFQAATFDVVLPFPALRAGWGLDAHWAAIARAHGWRIGIIDATPIRHGLRRIATSYDRQAAIDEARLFLADRPYVTAVDAQQTCARLKAWK
jgi:hypothetical protein